MENNKFFEPNPRSSLPNISEFSKDPNFATNIKEERRNSMIFQGEQHNELYQSRKSLPDVLTPKTMNDHNNNNNNNKNKYNTKKLSKTEKRRERSKEAILDIDLLKLILSFTETRSHNALLSMDKSQRVCQTNESHLMGFSFSLLNTNISHINLDIETLCLNIWHYNAAFGNITDVQKLLQNRVPGMNDTDIKQRTALHYSISNKKFQISQLLIESSCDVNKVDYNGITPIHLACALGNIPIYDLLIQYGADANKKNIYHDPPIYFAFLFGHTDMANHMMRRNSSHDYMLDGNDSSEKSENKERSFSWESEDPEFHTFCFQSNPPEIFLYYFTTPTTSKQEFITSTDLFKLWLHSQPQSTDGKKKLKDKIRNYICCTPSLSRGQHKHIKYPEHATSTKILPLIESQCKHYSLEKVGPTGWKLTLGSKASFVKQLFFDSSHFKSSENKVHLVLERTMWKCNQKWMNPSSLENQSEFNDSHSNIEEINNTEKSSQGDTPPQNESTNNTNTGQRNSFSIHSPIPFNQKPLLLQPNQNYNPPNQENLLNPNHNLLYKNVNPSHQRSSPQNFNLLQQQQSTDRSVYNRIENNYPSTNQSPNLIQTLYTQHNLSVPIKNPQLKPIPLTKNVSNSNTTFFTQRNNPGISSPVKNMPIKQSSNPPLKSSNPLYEDQNLLNNNNPNLIGNSYPQQLKTNDEQPIHLLRRNSSTHLTGFPLSHPNPLNKSPLPLNISNPNLTLNQPNTQPNLTNSNPSDEKPGKKKNYI
eukprot:TRINITY_DN1628_c0_g1_i1.p1 TRINITY_DN1628_c0_g1~~TRINITY_DN1628_c0_g1_i1.p1  ORF type:complete len:759 (+),score=199.90 TRINITY_DN1628_c0_g1_i1:37-2313(+)